MENTDNDMVLQNVQKPSSPDFRNIIERMDSINYPTYSTIVNQDNILKPSFSQDSKIQEIEILHPIKINKILEGEPEFSQPLLISTSETSDYVRKPFIVANTMEVELEHLRNDCIIPVFSKDNEKTIAHQEFIDVVIEATQKSFSRHVISQPEIRVSHQIKGRTPDAIHLNAKDLLENQKTIYYERMAFIIQIPSIRDSIN